MTYLDRTIIKQLTDFGLTGKEAVVYLTIIEHGILSAQQLSKNSDINRSSIYVILESLINKGLVRKSENDMGTSMYEALEPEILLREAEGMKQRQTEIHQDIDTLIPELTALSPALALHPRLKFYEGEAGIETALHDIATIKSDETIRAFSIKSTVPYCKSGQVVRVISPYRRGAIPAPDNEFLSVHFVPAKQYDFSSDIRIYADKIVLISEHEEFAVIIEDSHFAEVMRETFDLAWKESGRLDAQIRAKILKS